MESNIFLQRYGHDIRLNINNISVEKESSYMFKNIVNLREKERCYNILAQHNFHWKLGNYEVIYFWEDNRHNFGPLEKVLLHLYRISSSKFL